MMVILQFAHHEPQPQPAIVAIIGQPFTSNTPTSAVEADDINRSIEQASLESERVKR